MNLLAFDTSLSLGSVAVAVAGEVRARRFLTRQGDHASALIPAVESALREARLRPRDLDGVVVGAGPGSFTGVRVAAATAKGLVRALGIPLWPVSSLAGAGASEGVALDGEARALLGRMGDGVNAGEDRGSRWEERAGAGWGRPVAVAFDARGDRIYGAVLRFGRGPDAPPVSWVVRPRGGTLGELLDHPDLPREAVFAGDGALKHGEAIQGAGFPVLPPPAGIPTAEGLLRIRDLSPGGAPVADPGAWEPTYLRGTSARPLMPRP